MWSQNHILQVAKAVRIPTVALRFQPKGPDRPKGAPAKGVQVVFVPGPDPYKPVRRIVRLGLQGEDFVEVTKGLRAGERVLVRAKSTAAKRDAEPEDDAGNGN